MKQFCDSNNILSHLQFCFRDDFRTTDAIFVLRSTISQYKNKGNRAVYACFVDFSKAFDSVVRAAMFYKLGQIGIKGNILKLITSMYSSSEYIIKSNGEYSIPLLSNLGVKQGCNLGPILFNVFINDIHSIFNADCDPVNINGWGINSISFADDLVILSESPAGLNNSIAKLESYCTDWGLKINTSKTKILAFNRPFNKNTKSLKFCIDNKMIEVTKSYCYLGVEISNTGSFYKAADALHKKALRALYSIYTSLNVYADVSNIPLFLKLFDSLVKPVLLYGCEVWGDLVLKPNNPVDKVTNNF